MSTNFEWIVDEAPFIKFAHGGKTRVLWNDAGIAHIGKRSLAGMWCHACDVTLCKGGNDAVHTGKAKWHKRCPKCKANDKELGHACSFSWAQDSSEVMNILGENLDKEVVVDEYGTKLTGRAMLDVLKDIKIHRFDMIGRNFC